MKIDMITVPAGEFLLGSQPGDVRGRLDEQPQTGIFLSEYQIQKMPITVGQWKEFLQSTGYEWNFWEDANQVSPTPEHPIVYVNWFDATAFAEWLAQSTGEPYSLPTSAQWEKACRGTEGQLYPWELTNWQEYVNEPWAPFGDMFTIAENHQGQRLAVGSASLPSPYGCLDMWRNVREWCLDWYGPRGYEGIAKVDPVVEKFEDFNFKIYRGGSPGEEVFFAPDPVCHKRGYEAPERRHDMSGFRVAKFH